MILILRNLETKERIDEKNLARQLCDHFQELNFPFSLVESILRFVQRFFLSEANRLRLMGAQPNIHLPEEYERFRLGVKEVFKRLQDPSYPEPDLTTEMLQQDYCDLRDLCSGEEGRVSAYLVRSLRSDLIEQSLGLAPQIGMLTKYIIDLKKEAIEDYFEMQTLFSGTRRIKDPGKIRKIQAWGRYYQPVAPAEKVPEIVVGLPKGSAKG